MIGKMGLIRTIFLREPIKNVDFARKNVIIKLTGGVQLPKIYYKL